MRSIPQRKLTKRQVPSNKELGIYTRRVLISWLAALLICSTLSVTSAALAQGMMGSVTEIEGIAHLQRGGHNLNVALTTAIQVHDKLQTMHGAHLTITLRGGNQLKLAELTSIVIDFQINDTNRRVVIDLTAGRLVSIIRSGPSPAISGYEVHTSNAIAAVNSAEFEIAYIVGKSCPESPPCFNYTDVGVYKGIVQVSNPTNPEKPSVQVKEGLETAVPCDQPPTSPGPFGMHELGMPAYR
jgi:FecR protein